MAGKADAPVARLPLQHATGRSVLAQGSADSGVRRPFQPGERGLSVSADSFVLASPVMAWAVITSRLATLSQTCHV